MDRKTIGRYEVLDELGRGAMGSVLRARDPAMGRVIAIKSIHAASLAGEQAGEFRERFYREARAAGALAHPGIVPVFDVGEDDGAPFLVMELVQGRTLEAALKAGERYPLDRVAEIGRQIAEALGYAHKNGVIHRDIKPANILMTSREVYGVERPRITDFGVAKLAGGEATTTGQLLGTPAFMPPEQFTGAPIDGRSDLFSLGVILYRMATGEQPFPGETLTAVSYKVVHTEPIPPSKLNPALPPQFEAIILKCLAKSPDARHQTGEELAADLAAVRGGSQPVAASAPAGPTLVQSVGETIDSASRLRPQPPTAPVYQSVSPAPAPVPPQPFAPPPPAAPASRPAPVPQTVAAPPVPPRPAAQPTAAAPSPPPRTYTPAAAPNPATRPVPAPPTMPPQAAAIPARLRKDTPQAQPRKRGGMGLFGWLILMALAVGGTWFLRQIHVGETTSSQPASEAMQPVTPPAVDSVGFDPRTLGPETNARLGVDLNALPNGLSVELQMDGRIYWSGSAGDHPSYSKLFVPPGQHSFQVTVNKGIAQKTSPGVNANFAAGKRVTLTVKLFPRPKGGTTTLDPSTDVIVTLK